MSYYPDSSAGKPIPELAAGEPSAQAAGSAFVRVAAIAPFWRYAVGPAAAHSAAIPYYRLATAVEFFEETKRELPWAGVVLYKRHGLRGIKVVREYTPNTELSGGRPLPTESNPAAIARPLE